MTGKAYANRKPIDERPKGDFYCTPRSLVWCAWSILEKEFKYYNLFDMCAGTGCISDELKKFTPSVATNDLYYSEHDMKEDYLSMRLDFAGGDKPPEGVIMNPPFSQWDQFIEKAKSHADKVMAIGRLNYFGTQERYNRNLWSGLKTVYPFTRYVDYRTPDREDGCFNVGAMATAWFLFEKNYKGKPVIEQIDVSKYAKLGAFK